MTTDKSKTEAPLTAEPSHKGEKTFDILASYGLVRDEEIEKELAPFAEAEASEEQEDTCGCGHDHQHAHAHAHAHHHHDHDTCGCGHDHHHHAHAHHHHAHDACGCGHDHHHHHHAHHHHDHEACGCGHDHHYYSEDEDFDADQWDQLLINKGEPLIAGMPGLTLPINGFGKVMETGLDKFCQEYYTNFKKLTKNVVASSHRLHGTIIALAALNSFNLFSKANSSILNNLDVKTDDSEEFKLFLEQSQYLFEFYQVNIVEGFVSIADVLAVLNREVNVLTQLDGIEELLRSYVNTAYYALMSNSDLLEELCSAEELEAVERHLDLINRELVENIPPLKTTIDLQLKLLEKLKEEETNPELAAEHQQRIENLLTLQFNFLDGSFRGEEEILLVDVKECFDVIQHGAKSAPVGTGADFFYVLTLCV